MGTTTCHALHGWPWRLAVLARANQQLHAHWLCDGGDRAASAAYMGALDREGSLKK
jgi:hypothetical protein